MDDCLTEGICDTFAVHEANSSFHTVINQFPPHSSCTEGLKNWANQAAQDLPCASDHKGKHGKETPAAKSFPSSASQLPTSCPGTDTNLQKNKEASGRQFC